MRCWELQGCGGAMSPDCPHDASGLCPRTCANTMFCERPWHERASAMEMLEYVDVDFGAARQEACQTCRFFLERAPRIPTRAS